MKRKKDNERNEKMPAQGNEIVFFFVCVEYAYTARAFELLVKVGLTPSNYANWSTAHNINSCLLFSGFLTHKTTMTIAKNEMIPITIIFCCNVHSKKKTY